MSGWRLLEKDRYGARVLEYRESDDKPVKVWVEEDGRLCIKGDDISRSRNASRDAIETLYRAHDVRQAHAFLANCPHPETRKMDRLLAEVCSVCNGIRRKQAPNEPYGPWELETEGILRRRVQWPKLKLPEGWSDPDHPNFDEEATLHADDSFVPDIGDDESIRGQIQSLLRETWPNGKVTCPGCGKVWTTTPGSSFHCLVCNHEIHASLVEVPASAPRELEVDFNARDVSGHVRLNTEGVLPLVPTFLAGERVVLTDGEVRFSGRLIPGDPWTATLDERLSDDG